MVRVEGIEDHHRPGTVLTNRIDVFCGNRDSEKNYHVIFASAFPEMAFNIHHMRSVKALYSYALQFRRIRVKIEEIISRYESRFIQRRSKDLHVKRDHR